MEACAQTFARINPATIRVRCQLNSRGKQDSTSLEVVTDFTTDALWPRNAGYVVAFFAAIVPPITSSRTRAHLPLRLADEFAIVAQPLLHIPRGGATYVDSRRPCYVYRGRCSARHANARRVRWGARPRRLALDRAYYLRPFCACRWPSQTIPVSSLGSYSTQLFSLEMYAGR